MTLLYSYGIGWTPDDTQGVQVLILLLCLFFLRNTSPFFETVWNVVKVLLFIILVITTAGLAIKWLKKIF